MTMGKRMKFANVITEGEVIPQGLSFGWSRSANYPGGFEHPNGTLLVGCIFFRWGDSMLRVEAKKVVHADSWKPQAGKGDK